MPWPDSARVGQSTAKRGTCTEPTFDVDEQAIGVGVRLLVCHRDQGAVG